MHVTLVMLENGLRGREIRIRKPEIIIGRARGCKVRIASADVSRQHCRLRIEGTDVVVQDLGSSNGTRLNGELCQGLRTVHPFDRLQIGPITFLVEYDSATQPMPSIPLEEEELTVEAEDIIILDVEDVEEDHTKVTQPLTRSFKTRHSAVARPVKNPEEPLPWAELAESSLPPLPPTVVENLPVAEPDESDFSRN